MSFDPQKTWTTIVLTRSTGSFLGTYREAGAWIKVPPIRMVGAAPKAFCASEEMRKFFHVVCIDLILVETAGFFYKWLYPMGVMESPVTIPFHVGGVKAAGWSAWWWQSHSDLKNCKCQFQGFLWNWRFPFFRPVDSVLWGTVTILVIVAISIGVTFVVRTVS